MTYKVFLNWLSMKFYIAALLSISLMVVLTPSCIDPTDIGSELLDEDLINVGFTDTFTIVSTTIEGDSVRTHRILTQLDGYLLGDFVDPFFGRSTASFYGQVGMLRTASGLSVLRPELDSMMVDSIVLVMALDTNYYYGNTPDDEPFLVKVSQLDEIVDPIEDQYSNREFLVDPYGIGAPSQTIFNISPKMDSLIVYDYASGIIDTAGFFHFRLPLPNEFGERFIMADSTVYQSDSTFLDFFEGFAIEPISQSQGLISLDLLTSSIDAVAGLYLYYSHMNTGEPGQYKFPFNPYKVRTSLLKNDHSSAPVAEYIENPDRDSLTFIQGMEGLVTKIEMPYITENKGLIVNKAELELSIAELPGFDYDVYGPVEQIIISSKGLDGNLAVIADVSLASDLGSGFGGRVIKGIDDEPDTYKINISAHLQDMIDGIEPPELYLTTFRRALNLGQVAIYGGSHEKHPIKLNLYFTKQ
jgi:hypothetical protein